MVGRRAWLNRELADSWPEGTLRYGPLASSAHGWLFWVHGFGGSAHAMADMTEMADMADLVDAGWCIYLLGCLR